MKFVACFALLAVALGVCEATLATAPPHVPHKLLKVIKPKIKIPIDIEPMNTYHNKSKPTATLLLKPYKPYGPHRLWKNNPSYYEQINAGKYNKELIEDVSFANVTSNFGLLGQNDDLLLKHNPNILKLEIIRQGCPVLFAEYFVRKVNHLRSRHQAGNLALVKEFDLQSQEALNAEVIKPLDKKLRAYPKGTTVSKYAYKLNTSGVKNVLVQAEAMAKAFYFEGVKNYRSYGKAPKTVGKFQDFANLIWQSTTKVGVVCATVQKGKGVPVKSINDEIQVRVVYNTVNKNLRSFEPNVLPPGYFEFNDIKLTKYNKNQQHIKKKKIE